MSYEEKIEKLFSRHPSFQNVGGAAYKPGLETMQDFDSLLGHPHSRYDIVHIAGTNGKGSVSSLLASALSCAGRRIGLYTSPHLSDFRERIKIVGEDGFEMIPRQAVEEFLDRYSVFMDSRGASFFEITTAMAFWYFAEAGVDMAVVECGLGGRLDSTNIVSPLLSVITNIGLEHCAYLGDSLEKIAFEKAGIIKPGVPVVVGEINPHTRPVFEQVAAERGCPLVFAPEHSSAIDIQACELDLTGEYQSQNLATVKAALDMLDSQYGDIPYDECRLRDAARLSGLRGRWEKLGSQPDLICDIGHNAHGLRLVFDQLRRVAPRYGHVYIVFGVVSDKDVEAIAPLMIKPDGRISYIFTQPSTARAMPVAELTRRLAPYGVAGSQSATVAEALSAARSAATATDLVFIGGSNFTVSDALAVIAPNL